MSLRPKACPPRLATHDDDAQLRALFERAFDAPMSARLWHWKTQQLNGVGSVITSEETAIAYYGGIPRLLQFQQGQLSAIQIRDVMVDPSWRGLLTRKGPFWSSATHFLSKMTGDDRPYTLAFGFPNGRHAQLGRKLQLYAGVDQLQALTWQSRRLPWLQRWRYQWRTLATNELDLVEPIAQAMHQALTDFVVPQRSAQQLQQRYVNHPEHNYQLLFMQQRLSATALGVAVLHPMPDASTVELVDLIATPAQLKTVFSIALAAVHQTYGASTLLSAWLTPAVQAHLPPPDTEAATVADVHIATPNLTFWQTKTQNRWWLMSGDTDFR